MRCLPCLLLLAATPSIATAEEKAADLIRTGRLALRRDDFTGARAAGKKALALAERAVADNARDAQAYLLRGEAHELPWNSTRRQWPTSRGRWSWIRS